MFSQNIFKDTRFLPSDDIAFIMIIRSQQQHALIYYFFEITYEKLFSTKHAFGQAIHTRSPDNRIGMLPSDFHKGKIKRNFLKMEQEANVMRIWNIRCVQ